MNQINRRSFAATVGGFFAWLLGIKPAEAKPKFFHPTNEKREFALRIMAESLLADALQRENDLLKAENEQLRKRALNWIPWCDKPTGDLSRLVIIRFRDGNRGTFNARAVNVYESDQATHWAEFPNGPEESPQAIGQYLWSKPNDPESFDPDLDFGIPYWIKPVQP